MKENGFYARQFLAGRLFVANEARCLPGACQVPAKREGKKAKEVGRYPITCRLPAPAGNSSMMCLTARDRGLGVDNRSPTVIFVV